jgi:hypothetical protein
MAVPAKFIEKNQEGMRGGDMSASPDSAARDPEASLESLLALLDKNHPTNRLLARHPRASAELLEKLSHSSDKATRQAVASNPNTPPQIVATMAPSTSAKQPWIGPRTAAFTSSSSSLVTRSKTRMSSGSTGRCAMSGSANITGHHWRKCRTMQPHGCGVTTMTAHTWHWAEWHLSSG